MELVLEAEGERGDDSSHELRDPNQLVRMEDLTLHYDNVLRFAQSLVGSNYADAQNLTQETFLLAAHKLEGIRDKNKAKSWLFSIVCNLWKSARRLKRWEVSVEESPDIAHIVSFAATSGLSVGEQLEAEETGNLVRLALSRLDQIFQEVLMHRYKDGMSEEEIARRLNIPLNTVKTRLHRGCNHFKDVIQEIIPLDHLRPRTTRKRFLSESGRAHGTNNK